MPGLAAYLFLYVALYAGWGVLSPFLPAVLARRGATAEPIGLPFAAQHLAAMAVLARVAPGRFAATAQSVYASLGPGPGLAGAALTLAAGPFYARFCAGGFWAMALLCAAAIPAALTLRVDPA
jgi:MFS transporter, PPP family, 3-phenylpropionic acid transporter